MKPTVGVLLLALFLVVCALTLVRAKDAEDELTVNDEGDEMVVRVERAAGKGRGKHRAKAKECRYKKGQWEDCSHTTNEKKRTLTLKRGGKDCDETKIETKKCKKVCRYVKGEWGPCNPTTNQMERTDTLKPGGDPSCPPTRKAPLRKCRTACKYDRKSEWSPCDPSTDKRTKVQRLIHGDPSVCERTKIKTKACKTRAGKERCFFGSWSDWGRCENGVIKKSRPVLSGGPKCQKRAVKTKPCRGRS